MFARRTASFFAFFPLRIRKSIRCTYKRGATIIPPNSPIASRTTNTWFGAVLSTANQCKCIFTAFVRGNPSSKRAAFTGSQKTHTIFGPLRYGVCSINLATFCLSTITVPVSTKLGSFENESWAKFVVREPGMWWCMSSSIFTPR